MKSTNKQFLTFGLLLSLLASCGKDGTSSKSLSVTSLENLGPASGNFRLIATDAPFSYANVSSAKVTVERIEVKSTSDVSTSLLGQPITLDLVALKNGMVTAIVDLNLPPGEYKELRLVIQTGSIDLTSGHHYNLKIPSGSESGLKVFLDPAIKITTQASSDILLDFDLARSFVPQGDMKDATKVNGFIFKPVLRAANLTTAGTVSGKVISDNGTAGSEDDFNLAGAVVNVSQNGAVISTAVSDAEGNYKIIGLPQGAYSMEISSVNYINSAPVDFSIIAGNVTSAGETILGMVVEPVVTESTTP